MDQIYKGTEEDRMEPYYYSKMNKVQQAAYHAIRQGLLEISDSIQIPGMEAEELYNVFFRLRLDHPEIFWATGYKYKYYSDSPNFIFIPEYLFDKNKIKEHQKALKSRVEKLIRPVKDKSEWEKEKYVHDFICENVHYDKLKKPYSHEIIGPLGQGVGVCEGIAKSVKVLCDALGIWCMIAVCGNNPEKGIKYRHTWNIVKIGGKYSETMSRLLLRHQSVKMASIFIIKKRNCHLQRQRMYIKEHCRQRKREECLHSTGAAVI